MDRFIPRRPTQREKDVSKILLSIPQGKKKPEDTTRAHVEYTQSLYSNFFNRDQRVDSTLPWSKTQFLEKQRILDFGQNAPYSLTISGDHSRMRSISEHNFFAKNRQCVKVDRPRSQKISCEKLTVSGCSEISDDFYCNLIDWGHHGLIALGAEALVFILDYESKKIKTILDARFENYYTNVTAVSFSNRESPRKHLLAVGTNYCDVAILDCEASKKIVTFSGDDAYRKVCALDWHPVHTSVVTAGLYDGLVVSYDTRIHGQAAVTTKFNAHTQSACGLEWSPDGKFLASGSNDNSLKIWEGTKDSLLFSFEKHQAAVKALAWCPWKSNLLVSGGGTADGMIRLWDISHGVCVDHIDTGYQVCAVKWSTHTKEFVSSHGFGSNSLIVWKYPKLKRTNELVTHSSRVLNMVSSPDGSTIASCSEDAILHFSKLWDTSNEEKNRKFTLLR